MRDSVTRVEDKSQMKTVFSGGRRWWPGDPKVAQGPVPAGNACRPFRCLECDFWGCQGVLRTTELPFWLVPLALYATEPRCPDTLMALCSHGDFRGDAVENCVGQVALGMAVQTGKGYSCRWCHPENRGLVCGDSWSSV